MLLGFGAVNHFENCFSTDFYLVLFLRIRLQHRNLAKLELEDAAAGLFIDPADRTCAPGELRATRTEAPLTPLSECNKTRFVRIRNGGIAQVSTATLIGFPP